MAKDDPLSDIEKLTHSIAVLNDAMITFAENLGKINKLEVQSHKGEEQAIKDQQAISDMFGDTTGAMDELITVPEKMEKSSSFFGASMNFMYNSVEGANDAMEKLSVKTLITGKSLNFFAQNRRREQIATVKSFGSLRRAIMLSASFLSGVFVAAIKAVIGATAQAGQAGAMRGTGIEAVVGKDMETPASLTDAGVPFVQAMEATTAMFDAGLSRNVKGMFGFTKTASLLNMDIKRLAGHTRNLALTTGMGNEKAVALVTALQSTARMYNLNSERLIQAMEQLSAATTSTAMLAGTKTAEGFQQGVGLLAAKLGAGGEDMAAKLMASLNAGNQESFITLQKFGVDFEKAMGNQGGEAVKDEISKFAGVVTGMMRGMGAGDGVSYSDPILLGMMERLTGLNSEQLNTLVQLDDSGRRVSELTQEQILAEQEATAQRVISTDISRMLQQLLSDIYRVASANLLPIIQGTFAFLQNHGEQVKGWLTSLFTGVINIAKGIVGMTKQLIMLKMVSLLFKGVWAMGAAKNRIEFQREMIAHQQEFLALKQIDMSIKQLTMTTAAGNATRAVTRSAQTGAVIAGGGAAAAGRIGVGAAVARGAAGGAVGGPWGMVAGIVISVGAMALMAHTANDKLGKIEDSMTMSGSQSKLLAEMNAEIEKSTQALDEMKDLATVEAAKTNQKDPGQSITDMLQRTSIVQEELTREMITLLQDRNEELNNVSAYAMLNRGTSNPGWSRK